MCVGDSIVRKTDRALNKEQNTGYHRECGKIVVPGKGGYI